MCGLVGVVSAKLPPLDSLRGMTNSLVHRGPDDGDVWVDPLGRIALGHRRLSINDLSTAGHQPMHSAGGRYALVFNGEIYNHQAIRSDLHLAGFPVSWRGHSDTETLLAALECWGIMSTLNKCIGMFAFALWDKQSGTLHLARDRFGEKPLYYGWVGSGENTSFIFGSELKALELHPDFIKKISRSALAAYIRFLYVPAPQSIYEDIHKLEPGCLLSINLPICLPPNKYLAAPSNYPGLVIERWWTLTNLVRSSTSHQILDEDEAVYEVTKQLRDSVRLQLVSDVPLGAFLSGGIDSSLVTSLMQEQNSHPIKTFTIGFAESSFDESPHAFRVARYLGTDHTELLVTPSDAMKVIPSLSSIYDEPFADSSQIPTYLISSLARQSVTVALSGDGGDEMFGGYNRHILAPKLWKYLSLVPYPLRQAFGSILLAMPSESLDSLGEHFGSLGVQHFGGKVHKMAARIQGAHNFEELYWNLVSEWQDFSSPLIDTEDSFKETDLTLSAFKNSNSIFGASERGAQIMYLDSVSYLPNDILVKVDRAAMAVGLETRLPFLDHRVAELAWRLPMNLKIRNGQGKYILRKVLDQYIPREMIDRPKSGFSLPLGQWLRGPLKGWADDMFAPSTLDLQGYFKSSVIQARWNDHLAGHRDHSVALWPILMFQSWIQGK